MHTGVDLLPRERLLWEGRPVRHRLLRRPDLFYIPFSLLWTGLVAGGLVGLLTSSEVRNGPGLLVPVLFLAFGLYLTLARFVVRAVSSRRTRYLVTDRRVLVIGGMSGQRVRSEYLHALAPPVVSERPDGSGSLAFGAFPGLSESLNRRRRFSGWAAEPGPTLVLWDVDGALRVRDLVANAQAASR